MLSWKTRKKLMVVLFALVFANLMLGVPNAGTASDKLILRQADALTKQQRYAEALSLLKRALDFRTRGDSAPFERRLAEAEEMQASNTAFTKGMQCYKDGDYQKALDYFRQVNPKDVNNFTDARERICELDMTVVKNVINEKKATPK